MTKKDFFREFKSVRKILMEDWDPIGVGDDVNTKDEYDSYAFDIYRMLEDKKLPDELVKYLLWAEQDRMGLQPNRPQAQKVVAKLVALYVNTK